MDEFMGLRGPKPVNVDYLKADAGAWASFFYSLRDGQSGHMQRVKWGHWKNTGPARWTPVLSGRGRIMLPPNTRYRTSQALGPPILIPVSEAAQMLPAKMEAKGWFIGRPVMPLPAVWELLKRSRSIGEIRKASREIRGWMTEQFGPGLGRWLPGSPPLEIPDALNLYAEQVLRGKRLPSYAKTDRPRSDDKRVEFLSKVLAGARAGLAPITAAKRLSHWHFPRDWAEKSQKEYMEWSEKNFMEHGNVANPVGAEVQFRKVAVAGLKSERRTKL
jgi:hypothetical protein